MGLTGLLGVIVSGHWSDRSGPVWPSAICFAARIGVFALVMFDQSPASVTVFALVFGLTFLITAPLAVVFVRDSFGTKNLGALTGLITMAHHICGGIGAYIGASIFDRQHEMRELPQLLLDLLAFGSRQGTKAWPVAPPTRISRP
jgi:MFS family permease